ncbi:Alpha/beta hydrolase fold-1 - like 10 [Theobroma cacao]|nr:Alpha/beta hydrolase fold-1 - like 10 [Theobroma cacao]
MQWTFLGYNGYGKQKKISWRAKHFVLVHGLGHGAWFWYKLKPLVESAGHRVTTVELAASGINMEAIQDVGTFHKYTKPLLELLASNPPIEKVIVGVQSLGAVNLALAMDELPHKISVGVFLTAFMPDTTHQPSYVIDKSLAEFPQDMLLDNQFATIDSPENPFTITLWAWGPKFLASNLYQLSPVEDLELAKALVRPGSLFVSDLSKADKFSDERYGCVPRVYVVCNEDKVI